MITTFKFIIAITSVATLVSCASGPKFNNIRNGMTMDEVEHVVGSPDEALTHQGNQVYRWVDRLVSDWGRDTADYYIVIDKRTNTVGKHGRENYRQAVRVPYKPVVYDTAPSSSSTNLNCISNNLGTMTYIDCN